MTIWNDFAFDSSHATWQGMLISTDPGEACLLTFLISEDRTSAFSSLCLHL